MIEAKVIEDSIYEGGKRLVTMQLKYQRFIHGEFMTHRTFCLAGDSILDFDLPAGRDGVRRVHHMTLREFVRKWHGGVTQHKSSRHNGNYLEQMCDTEEYSAKQVADLLGHSRHLNLNGVCRDGLVFGAHKKEAKGSSYWVASGAAWKAWRQTTGTRTFAIRDRLETMRLRQVNEITGEVILGNVLDCCYSGVKKVFKLKAGKFVVVASADHRVLTADGWKRLKDIVPGKDCVVTYNYGSGKNPEKYKRIDSKWVSTWVNGIKEQVAARQGFKCAVSGEPLGSAFDIHHVVPKHQRPDLAFDIGNVVAVTRMAHRSLHERQGWQQGVKLGVQHSPVESIEDAGETDTYDLEMAGEWANFFADGVVVHNSRNASSSRAIPVAKMLQQVYEDPAMPVEWGKNQPGMQARENFEGEELEPVEASWRLAAKLAAGAAEALMESGVHKQITNRLLEPFQWIHVVVTATEWDNFFALRDHPDAQPEIRELARAMKTAMAASTPRVLGFGEWHLPYLDDAERLGLPLKDQIACSVARCARVSYLRHDLTAPSVEDDKTLHDRLVLAVPPHMSPTEHQATPTLDTNKEANLRGWMQYRRLIEVGEEEC